MTGATSTKAPFQWVLSFLVPEFRSLWTAGSLAEDSDLGIRLAGGRASRVGWLVEVPSVMPVPVMKISSTPAGTASPAIQDSV
jgi:hypothetical protein